MKNTIMLCLSLLMGKFALAQRPQNFQKPTKISLSGKVIDQETQQPLEYATITLKTHASPIVFKAVSPMKKGYSISKFFQVVIPSPRSIFLLKKTSKKGLFFVNPKI